MKAIRIHEHGGRDVLSVDEIDPPSCPGNKILVNIKAASLNHLDIWVREGLPGLPIPLPLIMTESSTALSFISFLSLSNSSTNKLVSPSFVSTLDSSLILAKSIE